MNVIDLLMASPFQLLPATYPNEMPVNPSSMSTVLTSSGGCGPLLLIVVGTMRVCGRGGTKAFEFKLSDWQFGRSTQLRAALGEF